MPEKDKGQDKEHLLRNLLTMRKRIAEFREQATELERVKEELRASEEKYRMAFEYTGTAMMVIEADTTISMANHRCEEVMGRPASEAGKHKWTEFAPPDEIEWMMEYHRKRREDSTSVPSEYEWRYIHPSGELRDMLMNVSLIPGTNKTLISVIDITERKRNEQRLRDSEQRFRDIADHMPGVIAELDLNLNLEYINGNGMKIFGLTEEDLARGINALNVIHADFHEKARSDIANVLAGDYGNPQEYRMLRKDGTTIWALVNSAPLLKGDAMVGFRTCLVDITERRHAQERLRESEARFRGVYDHSPVGITVFDCDRRIIDANESFRRMFHLSPADKNADWTLADFVDLPAPVLAELRDGKPVRHESELDFGAIARLIDGPIPEARKRHLAWHLAPLAPGDHDCRVFLAQVEDVTERRMAEELALRQAREAADRARRLAEGLRQEMIELTSYHATIVSRSPLMKNIFDLLPQMAQAEATVLVTGESGTGKELIARSLHDLGPRKRKPFVAVNCSALPDNLLESELFGYKAGAFTDAKKDKPGKFALAEGGTLFLDEIGDISPAMQVKLLRVLQERVYEPLGATRSEKADVRVIAATNKDLVAMVREGTFREDLFYRIKVLSVALPPLRDRACDIPLLCEHFVGMFNTRYKKEVRTVSEEVLNRLLSHTFPGNVRELENIIEHAFIFSQGDTIEVQHLPVEFRGEVESGRGGTNLSAIKSFDELEKMYIESVLADAGGNKAQAARRLGIHKATLFRKLKQLSIQA